MKNKKQVIIYISLLVLLFLSAINLNNYFKPVKVLGIKTDTEKDNDLFWQKFLEKNPNYLPALIEIGEIEKVKLLDPNFLYRP